MALNYILIITLISAFKGVQTLNADDQCLWNTVEPSRGPTICFHERIPIPSPTYLVPPTFYLNKCKTLDHSTNASIFKQCTELITVDICNIDINLLNENQHTDLLSKAPAEYCKGQGVRYNVTIEGQEPSKQIDRFDLGSVFHDAFNGSIDIYTLNSFNFRGALELLRLKASSVKTIQLIQVKAKTMGSIRMKNLSRIVVRDSKFVSLERNSFAFSKEEEGEGNSSNWGALEEVELLNLELEQNIKTGAIRIVCFPEQAAKLVAIRIENSQTNKNRYLVEENFLDFNQCDESKLSQLNVHLRLLGNTLEGFLPKERFRSILVNMFKTKLSKFYHDPLDCCYESNKWLFELQSSKLTGNESSSVVAAENLLEIDCSDFGEGIKVKDYREDIKKLEEICEKKNVYPIITIAIVSILLLAGCIMAFSVVCYCYVLPRKQEINRLSNRSPHRSLHSRNRIRKRSGASTIQDSSGSVPLTPSRHTDVTTAQNLLPLLSNDSRPEGSTKVTFKSPGSASSPSPTSLKSKKSILKPSPSAGNKPRESTPPGSPGAQAVKSAQSGKSPATGATRSTESNKSPMVAKKSSRVGKSPTLAPTPSTASGKSAAGEKKSATDSKLPAKSPGIKTIKMNLKSLIRISKDLPGSKELPASKESKTSEVKQ